MNAVIGERALSAPVERRRNLALRERFEAAHSLLKPLLGDVATHNGAAFYRAMTKLQNALSRPLRQRDRGPGGRRGAHLLPAFRLSLNGATARASSPPRPPDLEFIRNGALSIVAPDGAGIGPNGY
jgi:hypothetical protein